MTGGGGDGGIGGDGRRRVCSNQANGILNTGIRGGGETTRVHPAGEPSMITFRSRQRMPGSSHVNNRALNGLVFRGGGIMRCAVLRTSIVVEKGTANIATGDARLYSQLTLTNTHCL